MTLQSLILPILTSSSTAPHAKPHRTCRSWERRKEHRPSELLDAATDIFVARGYAAARLDDIAARAGVSKGTLYLYFASKEELFKAVVRVKFLPLIEEFHTRIQQATGCTEELLAEILGGWWCCFSQHQCSGIIKLIISEAENFPEIARFFHDEVALIGHNTVRQVVQRGIERKEFREPPDLDTAVHLMISPLIMKLIWRHSVGRFVPSMLDPENFIRHHTEMVLHVLRLPAAAGSCPAMDSTPAALPG